MKLNDSLRFPHPVLARDTGDYLEGAIDTTLSVQEDAETGYLCAIGTLHVSHPGIQSMVERGDVQVSLLVCCLDTYLATMHPVSTGPFRVELPAGQYRGTVSFRVVLGVTNEGTAIPVEALHPEFVIGHGSDLNPGDVIGIGEEFEFEAGLEKLAPLESVFQLIKSPDVTEPRFEMDTEGQAVRIAVQPELFEQIATIRDGKAKGALLSALYLPCVIELLSIAHSDPKPELRWYQAIASRCRQLDLPLDGKDLARRAQILLSNPLGTLYASIEGAQ